ncbi:MAG: sulfur carrier protein ThiS adenylyltransferase ThiF [Candidatus Delongbacteria bacterium]|jgi:sulfur carrier protein ThiS adenylyltransferase|nr:sulfur carrier protein ThiS adenylyltransferase ThiF [Candidatus Delongbacteria bacterium]
MNNIFAKNVPGMTEALSNATIGIAGCGGLGSNAAVALVRAGIGNLIIADYDIVESSNLNRQYFFSDDIGKKKVKALEEKLLQINPQCLIKVVDKKLGKCDICHVFSKVDILVEAFDKAESKQWLIEEWSTIYPEKPIISGNGIGGYGKINELEVKKIGSLYFCGDGKSSEEEGLCSARVSIVANMQASLAIELLMSKQSKTNER